MSDTSSDLTTFPSRLSHAMRVRGVTHAQLGERLGKARSAITHWCGGHSEPDLETIGRIAEVLRLRSAWLAVGDGAMDVSSVPPPAIDHAGPVVERDGYDQSAGA